MQEKIVTIDKMKVHYKFTGSGPVILILHGWGGSSSSWTQVMEALAKKKYKIIAPDLPGFGASQVPKRPWDVGDYMEWVEKFVHDLKLDRFVLIGHSFGGRVSIKYAVENPHKLNALILCDAAGIKHKMGFKARVIQMIAYVGNMIFAPKFMKRFKDMARNLFYIFIRNLDYAKADGVMKETIKRVINENLERHLPEIKNKTLLVWGKRDRLVPIEDGYKFKDKVKDSELKIISGINHSPHLEAPRKLIKIIGDFLKKLKL